MTLSTQGNQLHEIFPVCELIIADKPIRAKIDTADLPRVIEQSSRWNAYCHPGSKTHYVYHESRGTRVFLHRLITEAPAGLVVDHLHHDGLDNRRASLRVVVQGENVRNARREHGKHGRCVSWYKQLNCWRAATKVSGKTIHLGYFSDKEDAVRRVAEFLASKGIV